MAAQATPKLAELQQASAQFGLRRRPEPPSKPSTTCMRASRRLARTSPVHCTHLDEQETRELLQTWDMRRAVQLVGKGLRNGFGLEDLPA